MSSEKSALKRLDMLSRCLSSGSPQQQRIVVTGVTSGIGDGLVRAFLANGHLVAGCGRRTDRIESLSAEFPAGLFRVVDVTEEQSVRGFANAVRDQFGGVDVVIANAGTNCQGAKPWEVDPIEFERVHRVNTLGVFLTIRAFVPLIIESTRADTAGSLLRRMITISSGLGHSVNPKMAPYSSSKWAVESLTKCTAQALRGEGLANRIICVPLAPGLVGTELTTSMSGLTPAREWAKTAAEFILNIGADQNGASVAVTQFYDPAYMATWIIPANSPLPDKVVRPQ